MTLEWSHGKRRPTGRTAAGEVPSLPSVETVPERDVKTGRFGKGNQAARRRALKRLAKGLHTINPAVCEAWLQPYAKLAQGYAVDLAERLPDHPALMALVGDAADARAVYRGLVAMAGKGDMNLDALKEARGWLREHRAALATLAGLSKDLVVHANHTGEVREASFLIEEHGELASSGEDTDDESEDEIAAEDDEP